MRATEIINEAIPLSLAKEVLKGSKRPQQPHEDVFQHFQQNMMGRQKDRLYFQLDVGEKLDDSEFGTAKRVLSYIHKPFASVAPIYPEIYNKFRTYPVTVNHYAISEETKELYLKGLVETESITNDGRNIRTVRIGKLLNFQLELFRTMVEMEWPPSYLVQNRKELALGLLEDTEKMKKLYEEDPARKGVKLETDRLWVVICRHPYDLAGMSTGRGWTSCIDLDGSQSHHIPNYIKGAALSAYLIKKGDWNIRHPIARTIIDAARNEDGDCIFLPHETIYGFYSDKFEDFVEQWCNNINRNMPDGIYATPTKYQYPVRCYKTDGHIKPIAGDRRLALR